MADGARAIFSWWHRMLDTLVASTVTSTSARPALAAGLLALAIGAIGSGVYTGLSSGALPGARAALAIPSWAGVRLLVLLSVARDGSVAGVHRDLRIRAWAWSLVPFALAITGTFHILAFLASALVAWLVLESGGSTRRSALMLVAWAYGFQIAALLALWLARNIVLAGQVVLLG